MTVTYPRQLPFSSGFASGSDLTLLRSDAVNRSGAGQVQVHSLADPVWKLRLVTRSLRVSHRAIWKAWLLSMRGGQKRFLGHAPVVQYPLAYGAPVLGLTRAAGGSFDGTATLTAKTAYGVSLAGLPADYVASIGDMVSLRLSNGLRMIHIVTESATANEDGEASVSVEPFVRSNTVASQTDVQLVRASGQFAILHETISAPDGEVLAPVSFEAVLAIT